MTKQIILVYLHIITYEKIENFLIYLNSVHINKGILTKYKLISKILQISSICIGP